ncbi:MAG: hypothetical protein IJ055_02885 [Oscillospiraceae bacterium]|nr:hypothetical protein [Oscillospiraceae bacterium]
MRGTTALPAAREPTRGAGSDAFAEAALRACCINAGMLTALGLPIFVSGFFN